MKLLFIENRHKTYFFEPIAHQLKLKGFDIYWLIQNKEFQPSKEFKNYFIKYPKNKGNNFKEVKSIEAIVKADRQLNHFNKKQKAYFYYYNNEIENYITKIKPNLVFGESTSFHELLTIYNCKKQNILYLNPSSCRFPIGRFSFYKFDTLDPYSGSEEILNHNKALKIIYNIVNREVSPDYMKPKLVSKKVQLKDILLKIYSYYQGEKYNTPNPFFKFKKEQLRKKYIKIWNKEAEKEVRENIAFKVLYPLQMQPEANIDVWGGKYRNQKKLIQEIFNSLPENTILYIKPNPKSKYELTEDLILFLKEIDNIKMLHHSVKMDDVFPKMDLVITVTGTIAIECILSNKPIVTLVKTINNLAKNCIYIEDLSNELENIIQQVKTNTFKNLTEKEKISFINLLNSTSFKGKISDPFTDPSCISKQNIENLVKAFEKIIKLNE